MPRASTVSESRVKRTSVVGRSCVGRALLSPAGSMTQRAPLPRREAKPARERMGVRALIAEPDIECDIGQRASRIGQQRKRRIEPQTLQIAMRRFAERFDEQLMKAPHTEAAMGGQVRDA